MGVIVVKREGTRMLGTKTLVAKKTGVPGPQRTSGATRLLGLLAVTTALSTSFEAGEAQGQEVELPGEVGEWLERDQVQRWAAMIEEGDSIFNSRSCRRCHGDSGSGGRNGPDLSDSEWVQSDGSLEGIRETIFWGVRRRDFADPNRRFQMNPGGGVDLTWQQYASLAAYVWTLSNGTHLPER
jgi:Cytochrome C oxidase, cbb3-type, subunit III